MISVEVFLFESVHVLALEVLMLVHETLMLRNFGPIPALKSDRRHPLHIWRKSENEVLWILKEGCTCSDICKRPNSIVFWGCNVNKYASNFLSRFSKGYLRNQEEVCSFFLNGFSL